MGNRLSKESNVIRKEEQFDDGLEHLRVETTRQATPSKGGGSITSEEEYEINEEKDTEERRDWGPLKGALPLFDHFTLKEEVEVGEEAVESIHQGGGDGQAPHDVQEVAMIDGIERLLDVQKGRIEGLLTVTGMIPQEKENECLEVGRALRHEAPLFNRHMERW